MGQGDLFARAEQQLTICNACRYCEGYCAVFPALETQGRFDVQAAEYLSNLCHDCRDCLYACQYAPPHVFGVNIPELFAEVRAESHRRYAWPLPAAQLADKAPWYALRVALAAVVVLFASLLALAGPSRLFAIHKGPGAFYQVMPYAVMVTLFSVLGLMGLVGWVVEGVRYWRAIKEPGAGPVRSADWFGAAADALTLRYLGGGGAGCADPTDRMSLRKRWMHHLVAYGFGLDLLSTILAAIYQHAFHLEAPYPLTSPVVILGTAGGVSMLIGGIGLLALKLRSDPEASVSRVIAGDLAFITSLLLVAASGMLLLALRSTAAMGSLLAVHLGFVAALFLTAPYGKFRHWVFRYLALVRYRSEAR